MRDSVEMPRQRRFETNAPLVPMSGSETAGTDCSPSRRNRGVDDRGATFASAGLRQSVRPLSGRRPRDGDSDGDWRLEGRRRRTGSGATKGSSGPLPPVAIIWSCVLLLCLTLSSTATAAAAFCPVRIAGRTRTALAATPSQSPPPPSVDDIARLQEKARVLLEKSKAKLAASRDDEVAAGNDDVGIGGAGLGMDGGAANVPFFAAAAAATDSPPHDDDGGDRDTSIIKSRDEKTGLITTDGEKMAELSEQEEWEIRPLNDVFRSEMGDNGDVYSAASKQLESRDVAASIWNLRKKLQTEDYMAIFDKRNRFIGEDA